MTASDEGADVAGSASPSWLTLGSDEAIRWQGGPRIQTVLVGVAAGLGLAVAAGLAGMGWAVVVLAAVAPAVPAYLWVRHTDYVVTDEALYRKSGVVGRSVTTVGLDTVQNVGYAQSATGALFGYGTVEFQTAGSGETELVFRYVDDPETITHVVENVRGRCGRANGEIRGSTEQWRAVRDELRAIRVALESTRG